ncbi:DUF6602 domain-containing protein [Paenibacillus sp. SYP-B4298]|uniref:DUF6602 domain-containing protein n=1 Tax=Paenibacillus sp. SYP-B4298 TaxID=2996034 RepID=UPI0022DD56F9|nr:DUF6602 domain-containing protein [Paenibacillus sp. SYP-B4298]
MNKSLTSMQRKQKVVANIKDNYRQIERSIVAQLFMKHDLHGTTIGSEREDIWRQLFEMIIPKKFVIEQSAFIIDSGEGVSHEVDLVIMDETYTPYIFRYGRLKFIPIEAVAAVVECKSHALKEKALKKWVNSIEELRTNDLSIARLAQSIATRAVLTQSSTRPIRILCALENEVKESIARLFDFSLWATSPDPTGREGSDSSIHPSLGHIRIACHLSKGEKVEKGKAVKSEQGSETLKDWFLSLNHYGKTPSLTMPEDMDTPLSAYQVKDELGNLSLLTFNFQLNQLLMLINNPILFPHRAYVKMFNPDAFPKQVENDAEV